jgi:hypothetical protein
MQKFLTGTVAAAAVAGVIAFAGAAPASAQVAGARIATHFDGQAPAVTKAQWRRSWRRGYRRSWRRGYRRGWGPGAGFAAGLLFGSALFAPRVYGYPAYPYPYPYPAYSHPYPYRSYSYRPHAYDPEVEYCIRRFRSYDVYSGTYLGYDGRRHPCP